MRLVVDRPERMLGDYFAEALRLEGKRPARFPSQSDAMFPIRTLTYTAFDGDHFSLVPLMRKYVLAKGHLPVNPESIIGYKASVDAYGTKEGVLLADLAVLERCDQLLIFTDNAPTADGIRSLAEGVVIELLHFLYLRWVRGADAVVEFVTIDTLLHDSGRPTEVLGLDYVEVLQALSPEQQPLAEFVLELQQGKHRFPPIAFCLSEPLDAKYADWIQAEAHRRGVVPIVPSLALELGDDAAESVLSGWLELMRLADVLWVWRSIDGRSVSGFVQIFEEVACEHGMLSVAQDWASFGAPKAVYGESWPIGGEKRAVSWRQSA